MKSLCTTARGAGYLRAAILREAHAASQMVKLVLPSRRRLLVLMTPSIHSPRQNGDERNTNCQTYRSPAIAPSPSNRPKGCERKGLTCKPRTTDLHTYYVKSYFSNSKRRRGLFLNLPSFLWLHLLTLSFLSLLFSFQLPWNTISCSNSTH